MQDEHTEPEPGAASAFKHLPPRVMPEEMVETKAVVQPDSAVHSDTETEWMIRMGGGG